MGFSLTRLLKGLLISEANTTTPKEIEITPGGTAGTKTSIVSSQTTNKTLTLPNITDTLVSRTNTEGLSNKAITTSTLDSTPIGATTPAAATVTSLVATTADINGGTIDDTTIGATTPASGSFSSLTATTADVNGGTIDNTVIGGTTPAEGTFTDLATDSLLVNGAPVVDEDSAQTLKNKSLEDTTTSITDFTDPTIRIKFDAAGATATTTTLLGSQTVDRTLTLPDATDTLVGKATTDTLTNKTLTTPTITNPDIDGGSLDNTVIGATTPAAADFTTVDTTSDVNVGGNVVITGNLTVNGTQTILNTQTLDVEDTNITVNVGGNDASSEGAGLTVDRTGTSGSLIYKDASASKFAAGALGSEVDLADISSIQTLSNKSLQDTTTSIVDSVDPTKQIKFDAAGTTGTSTTLLSSQTTNKTLTLPDATDTLVGKATTDTLTNKTLQYLQQAVATNAALTGADQTLNTITTGIVRLTNGSLASLAGISAGASGQQIMVENKTGASVNIFNDSSSASASDRILTGTATTVEMKPDATLIFIYDTTSSRWHLAGGSGSGSGSGSGGVNFISTGDAESTNPFVGYQYLSTTRPVASAGSPAITGVAASISATAPLAGNNSFLITKTSGANAQGLAVDIPFTVSPAYRAKAETIEFDYQLVSGTFQVGSPTQDSDLIVYIVDVDSNNVIEPSNFKLLSNSTTISSKFSAQFQTTSTSVNYRLTFYTATTNAPNYSMKVDNIKVGPSNYVYGTPVTDLTSFTTSVGTGAGTVTLNSSKSQRIGDSIYVTGTFTTGTVAASLVSLTLPTGLSIDTTKINIANTTANAGQAIGKWSQTGTNLIGNIVTATGTSTVLVYFSGNNSGGQSLTPTNGSSVLVNSTPVSYWFTLPILGWSSAVQTSDNADIRVVDFVGYPSVNQALTANTTNVNLTTLKDSHGAWTGSTYVVPVPGDYDINAVLIQSATAASYQVYVNAVSTRQIGTVGTGAYTAASTFLPNLKTGDIISFRADTSSTIAGAANTGAWSIKRISGPATIAASETIAATYQNTAGTSITSTAATIIFATKIDDSHSIYNTGTGVGTIVTTGRFIFSAAALTQSVSWATTNAFEIDVRINGTTSYRLGNTFAQNAFTGPISADGTSILLPLKAGDTFEIRLRSSVTVSLSTTAGVNYFSVFRIGL